MRHDPSARRNAPLRVRSRRPRRARAGLLCDRPRSGEFVAASGLRHLGPSRVVARRELQRSAPPRDRGGDLRLPRVAKDRRAAPHRHRHARALGPGAPLDARGHGRARRRRRPAGARRVHADARRLARHPSPPTAPRRRAMPRRTDGHRQITLVAQPAGLGGHQIRPAPRRPGRRRGHEMDRGARERTPARAPWQACAASRTRKPWGAFAGGTS